MKDVRFFFLRQASKLDETWCLPTPGVQFPPSVYSWPNVHAVDPFYSPVEKVDNIFNSIFFFFYRSTLHSLKENSMTGKNMFFLKILTSISHNCSWTCHNDKMFEIFIYVKCTICNTSVYIRIYYYKILFIVTFLIICGMSFNVTIVLETTQKSIYNSI